ncbi:suppression of tumorigenicity 5 protein isoform x4 [Pitangus sulphuratus]|nr:suppression of tumorigenicity 5 protein isoform x4 [Pitangus sulphuratus]
MQSPESEKQEDYQDQDQLNPLWSSRASPAYTEICHIENRGERICERNNTADTKVSEEGGEGGAPGTGAEIPLQHVLKIMGYRGTASLTMEVHSGPGIHLQPVEDPMLEQMVAQKNIVTLWEAHTGAGSWQDLCTHENRSPRQSRFAGITCDSMGDPH